MCGITGALWFDPNAAVAQATLDAMTDAIAHRGPDDRGSYPPTLAATMSPVYTRCRAGLSPTIDHRFSGGHQPMTNEDGSITMVFNGEIYNYRQLRRRLEGSGHSFRTDSDTETIIHLYEDLGIDCFAELNGMFAIAIWDSRHRQLVLAAIASAETAVLPGYL